MRIIGLAGWSGAGKTTLAAKLIPAIMPEVVQSRTMRSGGLSRNLGDNALAGSAASTV